MMRLVLPLVLFTILAFYLTACQQSRGEGYRIATVHCQRCHQLPEPELLDKKTWLNYVLPKMGQFLGFRRFDNGRYFEQGNSGEAMPLADWNQVVAYYVNNAPDSIRSERRQPITIGLNGFDVAVPAFGLREPATTFTQILPDQQQVVFGDGMSEQLYRLNAEGALLDSFPVGQGVVAARFTDSTIASLDMGVLYPSDEKKGHLRITDQQNRSSFVLLDSLQRPVFFAYSDLNGDGQEDIIVCEFGNLTGQLSWFQKTGGRSYRKHVLRALPGAVRVQVADLNHDAMPDIIALMAQGDEGTFAYINQGNGQFAEKRLLQFPPSYGSNFFELVDVNKDGFPDIVATNGDNGDYPPILKPYHGIRVYLNDGQNGFKEALFLPMNGACKALARDFDGDGDLDIAAISYFPDYEHTPEESFVYWENTGGLQFRPFSFQQATAGRWLTMDAGDLDKDGDTDLVLGNAKFTLGAVPGWLMAKWDRSAPSVLILKNRQINKK